MEKTVKTDLAIFRKAFEPMTQDNFSYFGLEALFNYLEMREPSQIKGQLDVQTLCRDFAEDTPLQIAMDYELDLTPLDALEDKDQDKALNRLVIDFLEDENALVGSAPLRGTLVYRVL